MAVVTIIGLLAALAIPNFVTARDTAMRVTCTGNQRVIYEAAEMYGFATGSTLEGLGRSQALQRLLNEGYLKNNTPFECPESKVDEYYDYRLVYQSGDLADINCTFNPSVHLWPETSSTPRRRAGCW